MCAVIFSCPSRDLPIFTYIYIGIHVNIHAPDTKYICMNRISIAITNNAIIDRGRYVRKK